eukprot:4242345-Prymnesium_polylepis.1
MSHSTPDCSHRDYISTSRPVSIGDRKIRYVTAEMRATRGIYICDTHPHCTYAKDDTRPRRMARRPLQASSAGPSAQLELAHQVSAQRHGAVFSTAHRCDRGA